jgi:surface antigen
MTNPGAIPAFLRWASLCLLAVGMAGCASDEPYSELPPEPGRSVALDTHQKPQQCVPYAREHSNIKIFGDAWTWWDRAEGKFPRGPLPREGAVMVLTDYAGPSHGHVAVVKRIVSPREIRIDHANWLDDGSIYLNDPVEDVSSDNDWSKVRVYNIKTGGWGVNVYPVQGFIGGTNKASELDRPPPAAPPANTPPPELAPAVPPPASNAPDDNDPLPDPDKVVSANYPAFAPLPGDAGVQ